MTDHTTLLLEIVAALNPFDVPMMNATALIARLDRLNALKRKILDTLDTEPEHAPRVSNVATRNRPPPVIHSILKFADLSTGHVTRRDMAKLHNRIYGNGDAAPLIATYPQGAFLYPPEDDDDTWGGLRDSLKTAGYSDALFKCLLYAHDNQCYLLRLDADGAIVEGLDYHEW